ncbi:hypothetical protein BDW22DRAFT_1341183 [Trametopsis cervina]|nr:hypothetical protein BDW22DRAFT_1341183 [Trametopsis cervina]
MSPEIFTVLPPPRVIRGGVGYKATIKRDTRRRIITAHPVASSYRSTADFEYIGGECEYKYMRRVQPKLNASLRATPSHHAPVNAAGRWRKSDLLGWCKLCSDELGLLGLRGRGWAYKQRLEGRAVRLWPFVYAELTARLEAGQIYEGIRSHTRTMVISAADHGTARKARRVAVERNCQRLGFTGPVPQVLVVIDGM